MRIAVIFDNFGPYHRARLRAASEVCALLAIQVNQRSRDYDWEPNTTPLGFESLTLNQRAGMAGAGEYGQNNRLRRCLRDFRPDCVFIPGWSRGYSLAALAWCRANRVPAVVMSESTKQDAPRTAWKEWLKARLVGFYSGALVGGSAHGQYLDQLGMSPELIFDGYDVVDNNYFHRATSEVRKRGSRWRAEFALPDQYFLASARFIQKKNLPHLVAAYAGYRLRFQDSANRSSVARGAKSWSLVVLGDGPERGTIEQLISQHGLESFVVLPGFRQYGELPVYYGLASAFVHVSISEPWGLVVNEAMASGLPVLVSNRCGCVPDLVRDGRNGFSFDPNNIEQLAELMARFSTAGRRLSAMGAASLDEIAHWAPDRFALGLRAAACKAVQAGLRPSMQSHKTPFRLLSGR